MPRTLPGGAWWPGEETRVAAMSTSNPADARAAAAAPAPILALCLDVDGTLTDGRLYVHDDGTQSRAYHTQDGFAIRWFQRLGGTVLICTGKAGGSVRARAAELGIDLVIENSADKRADVAAALAARGIPLDRLAVIGDDLPDLPLLRVCGLPIAVANAVPEVRAAAAYVTQRSGGGGAVREAIEYILRADGRWSDVLAQYARRPPA